MSEQDTGAEAINSDESQFDTLRESIDDPQVLKAQLAREAEARRQLTARAKAAEAKVKELETTKITQEVRAESNNNNSSGEDERLELRLDGYSKEEVGFIMANGGRDTLKDNTSYVAIAINTRREQLNAEKAASQTDQSGGEDSLKAINFNLPKNPTASDLKKSIAEMEKALPHAS